MHLTRFSSINVPSTRRSVLVSRLPAPIGSDDYFQLAEEGRGGGGGVGLTPSQQAFVDVYDTPVRAYSQDTISIISIASP